MKNLFTILAIAVIFTACGPKPQSTDTLLAKRDSLQKVILKTKKELNKVEKEIALNNPSTSKDDKKTMKKIIMQKNKIAQFEHKISQLENTMSSDKSKSKNIAVSIKEMNGEPFNHYFTVFGNAEADNYGMISPEMAGKIDNIYVNEGQKVTKGTLLLSLNTEAIEKQIKGVESSLEMATTTFNKQQTLWDQKIGSEIQYLQAKSTKESLEAQLEALQSQVRMSQLRAPYNGTVNRIYPKKGEMASPGFPVVEFVNLTSITVKANVSEKYLSIVKKGQVVEVQFSSIPGYSVKSPIVRVSNVIDSKSRTFEIELALDNPDKQIKPNMVSTIYINDFSAEKAKVIPSLAIRKDINGNYVYIIENKEGSTVVAKRRISTGRSYQDKTMITKGLKSTDKVIVKGFNLVSSGIPVTIK